jgi:hypothetical protein
MQRAISVAMLLSAAWTSALSVSAMSVHSASQLVGVRDSLASTNLLPPVSSAQPLNVDDESETEALVAKAHNLTNLTAADSAPFRFRATLFFYDPSGDARVPPVKGSYAFTWATPSKWREDADLLHLKQTEIASGTALWTKRNAPYPSFGYWWTRNAIGITRGVVYHFDSRTRVEISQVSGRNVVCARNGGTHVQQELCLDTATSLPVAQYDATLHVQILFANWTPWGSHWYPRTIRVFSGSEQLLRVEIENVFDAPAESSWIVPPEGAVSRDWCADMRPARISDAIANATLPDPIAPLPSNATQIVGAIVYGLMGKDGNWLDLSVLESPDFKAAYQMLDNVRQVQNQPATCHGTPVDSELIFRISPQAR